MESRIERNNYSPFGSEWTNDVLGTDQKLRFTGHERDLMDPTHTTDDIDYMHARHYNLNLARFLSVDPVGGDPFRPQSWNGYAYVLNNPLRFTDPFGLEEEDSKDCAGAGAGDTGCGRADVTVPAEDPEPTVDEIRLKMLRIAGGKATTNEVPWGPEVQNGSIVLGGSVPIGAVKKVGGTVVPIPARLTGSISVTLEGVFLNIAISPGLSTASGYLVITETKTFGNAVGDFSTSFDYQGGAGVFGGGEVTTDWRTHATITGKIGLGIGQSGGFGKDLSFSLIDNKNIISFQ